MLVRVWIALRLVLILPQKVLVVRSSHVKEARGVMHFHEIEAIPLLDCPKVESGSTTIERSPWAKTGT